MTAEALADDGLGGNVRDERLEIDLLLVTPT